MGEIRELVLTGGPCAGKSTALALLATELPARGWRVLRVPEAATMFLTGDGPKICKRRHVFVYDGQRFELDEIFAPVQAWILEVELASADVDVRLPPVPGCRT